MMNRFKKQLEEIDGLIQGLKKERYGVLDQWIEEECPVKVGDTVRVNGYAHRGKMMVVRSVRIKEWASKYEWSVIGPIIKKDGTPGQQDGEWRQDINE
jgi:hypothetical protein